MDAKTYLAPSMGISYIYPKLWIRYDFKSYILWVCTSLRYIDFENRINDVPYQPNGYMEVKNIPTQHWYIHPS